MKKTLLLFMGSSLIFVSQASTEKNRSFGLFPQNYTFKQGGDFMTCILSAAIMQQSSYTPYLPYKKRALSPTSVTQPVIKRQVSFEENDQTDQKVVKNDHKITHNSFLKLSSPASHPSLYDCEVNIEGPTPTPTSENDRMSQFSSSSSLDWKSLDNLADYNLFLKKRRPSHDSSSSIIYECGTPKCKTPEADMVRPRAASSESLIEGYGQRSLSEDLDDKSRYLIPEIKYSPEQGMRKSIRFAGHQRHATPDLGSSSSSLDKK